MAMRAVVLLVLFSSALIGCSRAGPVESATDTPIASPRASEEPWPSAPPEVGLDDLAYACGSPLTFPLAALDEPLGAETVDHPAVEALRGLIELESVPQGGSWQLVALSANRILFLRPPADGDPGGPYYASAELEYRDSAWHFVRSGGCSVEPVFRGIGLGAWEIAPDQVIGPQTIAFDALVTEQSCASGQNSDGRIGVAEIIYGDTNIVIILGVRPMSGAQTCQGNPTGHFTIELEEPIGGRTLLDGSVYPPEARGP